MSSTQTNIFASVSPIFYQKRSEILNQGLASIGAPKIASSEGDDYSAQPGIDVYYSEFSKSFVQNKEKVSTLYKAHNDLAEAKSSNENLNYVDLGFLIEKNIGSIDGLLAIDKITKEITTKDASGKETKSKFLSLSTKELAALKTEGETLTMIADSILSGKKVADLKSKNKITGLDEELAIANRLGALLRVEKEAALSNPDMRPVIFDRVVKALARKAFSETEKDETITYKRDDKGDYAKDKDGNYIKLSLLEVIGDCLSKDGMKRESKESYSDFQKRVKEAFIESQKDEATKTVFYDKLRSRYLDEPHKSLALGIMSQIESDRDLLNKASWKARSDNKAVVKKEEKAEEWSTAGRAATVVTTAAGVQLVRNKIAVQIAKGAVAEGFWAGLGRIFVGNAVTKAAAVASADGLGLWASIAGRGILGFLFTTPAGLVISTVLLPVVAKGLWSVFTEEKPEKDSWTEKIQNCGRFIKKNWLSAFV